MSRFDEDPFESGAPAEPSQADDPVARFFARARDEVEPQPITDLSWQEVVRGRRTSRRPRSWYTAVATAAAACVALFAVWTWQQTPIDQQSVTPGSPVVSAPSVAVPTGSAPPEVSKAQQPRAVPKSFVTWSLSNAGSGTLYDLGSSNCQQEVCVTLLRSSDNGHSWDAVHTFADVDTSSATGSNVPQVQPTRAVSQVRFITPQVGYVFGGDLWITRDRGASFTKMDHPGQTVLDVEIHHGRVIVVSADGCIQGSCSGPIYVSRTTADAKGIATPTATTQPAHPITSATAVVHERSAFVQLASRKSGSGSTVLRLSGSQLTQIKAPSACTDSGLRSLTVAADVDKLVYAVCRPVNRQQNISYTLVRSTDGGHHWTVMSTGALVVPRLGQLTVAADDSTHVVVSMGGPRDPGGPTASSSVGSLQQSDDGGRSFHHVQTSAKLPAGGFDWAASPGGDEFYALSHQSPTYWKSVDNGNRWTVVDPRS